MASMQWLVASFATAVAVALQAPLSSTGSDAGAEPSGNETKSRLDACGTRWAPEVTEEMEEMGLQRPTECGRRMHRARIEKVMWIHLHKAAGSTMCALAKENGEAVVAPDRNCNWYIFDTLAGRGRDCHDRLKFFNQHNVTWGAIERVVKDADFCPGLNYALLLREPTTLLYSAIKYHRYTRHQVQKSITCVQMGDCNVTVTGVPGTEFGRGRMQIYLWWYLDNFVVRTLGGEEAREAPPGKLQQKHVDKAMEVLKRMQVVLLLEELTTGGLARAFGWSIQPEAAPHKKETHEQGQLSDEDMPVVRGLNKHDYVLYEYIKGVPMEDRVSKLG